MRIDRFYCDVPLHDSLVMNDPDVLKQWRSVLRFAEGDVLRLFNGKGIEREYRIDEIDKDSATLSFLEDIITKTPKRSVTLFFSLLKKDKNELVIQKCTELGVSRFVPVLSDRTEKTGFVRERMERIVVEAAEQCGRGDIPSIDDPMPLTEAIASYGSDMTLIALDAVGDTLPLSREDMHALGYFIGPEGGWSDAERAQFAEAGIMLGSFGPFTLRAETACIVGAARLLYDE